MTDRILDQFLQAGLLDLKGNDDWHTRITAAADSLSDYLRQSPDQLPPFVYAALDTNALDTDPAIERTLELLKDRWKTYASVFAASPIVILRAIIIDAVVANAARDDATETALALLVGSALPFVDMAGEEEVWTNALRDIQDRVESRAETAWSVPSRIEVPPMPKIDAPTLKVSVKAGTVDEEGLSTAMLAASAPTDEAGQPTGGNTLQPAQGLPWSHQFAPLAAEAITAAITSVAPKIVNVKADALYKTVTSAVMGQLEHVLTKISAATLGLELRSRLLWWKEAMISPSARVSYRSIDRNCVPALMAYDYQVVLPALTPVSVIAFLTETVTTLLGDNSQDTVTFADLLEKISTLPEASGLRAAIGEMDFAEGRQPLISTIRAVFVPSEPTTSSSSPMNRISTSMKG